MILLDIKMPRMDGIEVLQAVRGDSRLEDYSRCHTHIFREEPDLRRCYDLCVNAYVVKPVDFGDFIEAVKQAGVFWALINELPPEPGE